MKQSENKLFGALDKHMLMVLKEFKKMLKPPSRAALSKGTNRDAQLIQNDSPCKLSFLHDFHSLLKCKIELKLCLFSESICSAGLFFIMTYNIFLETSAHWESVWSPVFSFPESHRAPSVQRHLSLSPVLCDLIK